MSLPLLVLLGFKGSILLGIVIAFRPKSWYCGGYALPKNRTGGHENGEI